MNSIQQKLWCLKSVRAPGPISRMESKQTYTFLEELSHFKVKMSEAYSFYSDMKFLHAEYVLLERCIYRMKLKFRSDKGFKALQKVLKSLNMFFDLDIAKIVYDVKELINEGNNEDNVFIPGTCNVQFLLVRLQTVAKLMERVIETTREAALYIHNIILIGHSWRVLLVCFGIVSRLQINAINILKYTCKSYSEIKSFHDKDDKTDLWIPNEYKLPNNLYKWIGTSWFEEQLVKKKNDSIFTFNFDYELLPYSKDYLNVNEDIVFIENQLVPQKQVNSSSNTLLEPVLNKIISQKSLNDLSKQDPEDLGELVERNKLTTLSQNKKKKKPRKQNKHGNITHVDNNIVLEKYADCLKKTQKHIKNKPSISKKKQKFLKEHK